MRNVSRILLLLSLPAFMACTRKVSNDAVVSLSFSDSNMHRKVSAMSLPAGAQLARIMVNVRSGGTLIPYVWDGQCDSGICLIPPPQIQIDVPSGAALIQYLAAYQDANSQMYLAYGDSSTTLVSGTNDVYITPTLSGTSSAQATIAGQYLDSASGAQGYGRTGRILMQYHPPPTATVNYPMYIDQSEIFNGWFQVFGLSGVPVQYVFAASGNPLVGVSYDSIAAGQMVAHLASPLSYAYCWNGSTGCSTKHGGELFLGFFGSSSALATLNPFVYFPSTASLNGFYTGQSGGTYTGSSLTWMAAGATSPTATSSTIGVMTGGTTGVSGNFTTSLYFDPLELRNGQNSAPGFVGPFADAKEQFSNLGTTAPGTGETISGNYASMTSCDQTTTGVPAAGCYDGNGHIMTLWNYLPGVFGQADSISGVALFMAQVPSCSGDCTQPYQDHMNNGIKCSDLAAMGASEIHDFGAASPGPSMGYEVPKTIQPGATEIGFLCPYRTTSNGREFFHSAAVFQVSGPPGNRAEKFDGTSQSAQYNVATAYTVPSAFTVEAYVNYTAQIAATQTIVDWGTSPSTSGISLYIDPTGNLGASYLNSSCVSTSQASTLAVSPNAGHHVAVSLSGSTLSIGLDGQVQTFSVSPGTSCTANMISVGSAVSPTGTFLGGLIDEVRISNGALYPGPTYTKPTGPLGFSSGVTLALFHLDGSSSGAACIDTGSDSVDPALNGTPSCNGSPTSFVTSPF